MKYGKLFILLLIVFVANINAQVSISDVVRISSPTDAFSARAMGMGNAFTSLSDDYSAFKFNPAGLGFVRKMELSGGLDYSSINDEASFLGTNNSTKTNKTKLNNLNFIIPFPTVRGSFVIGASYNVSKTFDDSYEFQAINNNHSYISSLTTDTLSQKDYAYKNYLRSAGRSTVLKKGLNESGNFNKEGEISNWVFSGALEIEKNLFIGASFTIISGTYDGTFSFTTNDELGVYKNTLTDSNEPNSLGFESIAFDEIKSWDISGTKFELGFLYQFDKIGRFGCTIEFPHDYTIKQKSFFFDYPIYFKNYTIKGGADTLAAKYDLEMPFVLNLGASIRISDFIVAADLHYTDYSQIKLSPGDGLSDGFFDDYLDENTGKRVAGTNTLIKKTLTDVLDYNLGLEYMIKEYNIRLRTGFFTKNSPYKNDPSKFNKKYLTFGAGFLLSSTTSIDLGYMYGWWSDLVDNYGQGESRVEQKYSYSNIKVGISYRF